LLLFNNCIRTTNVDVNENFHQNSVTIDEYLVQNVKFSKKIKERLILITQNCLASIVTHCSLGGQGSISVRG
jgi:hypothetical protein